MAHGVYRRLKEKSNACKIYLSSLVVSYRHSATFHSPILGDMLPADSSILYPENAPGQTIWKEEAAVALYAAVVFCVRAARVR
jgi:hypothetical protein